MGALVKERPDEAVVLSKALFRAAEQLGLKQQELADVLGLHRTGITRLKDSMHLKPQSKTGEMALLLVRAARSVYALVGGDEQWTRAFMRNPNKLTGGIPAEQIKTVQGLVGVVECLDALRGKV